jgi:hypothetical protein
LTSGVVALLLAAGCEGQVTPGQPAGAVGQTGSGGTGTGIGNNGPPLPKGTGGAGVVLPGTGGGTGILTPGDANAAGVRPLRLLTRREYTNTVRDLLSDTSTVTPDGLPSEAEDPAAEYAFHTTGDVATLDATLYRQAAETLAAAAVPKMNTLLPCAASATTTNDTSCLSTFMTTLAQRAYRRPLAAAEKTKLMSLYNIAKAPAPNGLALNFSGAIGFVLEGILQSAEFLYHWEVDSTKADIDAVASTQGNTVVRLGNYEMANRLSYFLWGTMPDQMLFDLAAQGQLVNATVIEAQVKRMLQDTNQSGAMFGNFFVDWLDLDRLADAPKDPMIYAQFTPALVTAMLNEVQSFVGATMTTGTGRFSDIMTGTNTFANQDLAKVYGVPGVTGTALKPVALNPMERSGLLTSAGFMSLTGSASGSNPPRRGKVVFNKLLCGTLPAPPPDVPDPKPITPGVTTRQRFEEHSMNPCAGACHQVLDPLGFAFENYDGIGQYRTMDSGLPVNASVTFTVDGTAQNFTDAKGMLAVLATSDQAQACFTKQWFRYALGRLDTPQDGNSMDTVAKTFKGATGDIRTLVTGLSTSRTFRYRTISAGEVLQ